MFINTSNSHKQEEYRTFATMFHKEVHFSTVDLKEPLAGMDTVIRYKASQFSNVFIEDSALHIEGVDCGVNVRWLLDRLTEYDGKKATFEVKLAIYKPALDEVCVWSGRVLGTIRAKSKSTSSFGFDNIFVPDGQNVPYAIFKPYKRNPRYLALSKMLTNEPCETLQPLKTWNGPWQNE